PKSHRELWPPVYRAEAAEDARQRGRRDRTPAPAGTTDSGHAGILPEHSESEYRRPDFKESVSIRAAERRHGFALSGLAGNARQDREDTGIARCHHGSLYQEPADDRRHRPREGSGLWRHRRTSAQPALQRLWRATGR